ncbi:tRNA methyltransferase ppm2 [Didymosphaeria variabile]|uniref:tRNA wybutosine-synthesizing protein 4 n=1 Tax=Didymosphaeria variabile TaxID=1932322 RepID=A0A9W8XK30_9PLEO|nr:tRNA methyltransferase ppm2 [Didymosphaeria variabile]KAJ4352454.1 tRNA methyltransferase ppm2 [Didymosphaeria variabile]
MLNNEALRNALFETNLRPTQAPVYVRSDRYLALGCDLRDLKTLERLLRRDFDAANASFLFVAEVSVTYMPTPDADSVIRWASTLDDVPSTPFSNILSYTNKHPGSQMQGGHSEWEEFALFAGHYFLLVASTANKGASHITDSAVPSVTPVEKIREVQMILTHHTQSQLESRRFGAAVALGQNTAAFHGGQGVQTRLTSIDVLVQDIPEPPVQPCKSTPPQARICHTVTAFNDTCALLVGGRASPSHALADCWLISAGQWTQVGDLPSARFRHSSVRVTIPSSKSDGAGVEAVLAFGGKTSDGHILDEWVIWTREDGWNAIPVNGPRPSARFGAALSTIAPAQSWGVMCGGMAPSGVVLQDLWEWHITAARQLEFFDRTSSVRCNTEIPAFGRLGASLVPFGDRLLLIGGVSKQGILDLPQDFLAISHDATAGHTTYDVQIPALKLSQSMWPLLVGTSAAAVSDNEIILAGGGAVCFSMGSFWNTGHFSITRGAEEVRPWTVAVSQSSQDSKKDDQQRSARADGKQAAKKKGKGNRPALPASTNITRIQIDSSEHFANVLAASKPVIIENLDIGACRDLWTLDYLKEKIGAEREVVIHECASDRMTFKDKNFSYVKKPFGDFLEGISAGAQTYLRAVSSAQPNRLPTNLEDDFPSVAGDFKLPDVFDVIRSNLHSSPLRISGPVALWLHYDVLANVLCQVRGSKTLHLFPPADVKHLSYPPGGSSSNVDILTSRDTRLSHTHPHTAHMRPGDILFIPPMWSHTAVPEDGVSVAVNVFFRNLESGYAAGKDVYGNRDLQAYENGRRDVERIAKAFKNIPDDMAKFYMDRLAMELKDRADAVGKSTRSGG